MYIFDVGLLCVASLCVLPRSLSTASCKVHITLVYMSLDTSVWILVAFTGERILSVFKPYKVKNICTRITSLVLIAAIIIVMLILNSHFMYGMQPLTTTKDDNTTVTYPCWPINSKYKHFLANVWPWVDFCVFNLVPFLLLSIGNTCIAVRVVMSQRRARKVRASEDNHASIAANGLSTVATTLTTARGPPANLSPPASASTEISYNPKLTNRRLARCAVSHAFCIPTAFCQRSENQSIGGEHRLRQERPAAYNRPSLKLTEQAPPMRTSARNDRTSSMTAILLLLNIIFLATTTPVSVFFIIQDSWSKRVTTAREQALFKLTFTVVNLIQYANNSLNFILYCITGSRFRKELQAMLFKRNRVFPAGGVTVRRPRALEREITGLHTRMTVAADDNEAQAQTIPSGNNLTVPVSRQVDTHI